MRCPGNSNSIGRVSVLGEHELRFGYKQGNPGIRPLTTKIAGRTRESNVNKQCVAGMVTDSVRMQRTCLLPGWRYLPQTEQEMNVCIQTLTHPGLPVNATASFRQALPERTPTLDPFHSPG